MLISPRGGARLGAMRAFLLAALTVASSAATSGPLQPVPAACTSALMDAVKADLSARETRVKELAARVRAEKSLFVAEARAAFARAGAPPPPSGARDPFSYAERLDVLRPRLSEKEWARGVGLWAGWLEKTEASWEKVGAAEYCGLAAEGRSFAQDAYLTFLPFIAAAQGNDELIPVAHLAAASGVLSLGLDVVAFVPNVALSAGKRIAKDTRVRGAARAFRRFADFVEAREKAVLSAGPSR